MTTTAKEAMARFDHLVAQLERARAECLTAIESNTRFYDAVSKLDAMLDLTEKLREALDEEDYLLFTSQGRDEARAEARRYI